MRYAVMELKWAMVAMGERGCHGSLEPMDAWERETPDSHGHLDHMDRMGFLVAMDCHGEVECINQLA